MTIKSALAILALAAGTASAFGFTVEVALIESAGPTGGQARLATSESVIGGALDGLFDSGTIGTNSRPVSGSAEAFLGYAPRKEVSEAYIDFVIVILAEYAASAADEGKLAVPSCRYRLIRVADGSELAGGSLPAIIPASLAEADVLKACGAMGKAIATACGRALSGPSASWRVHAYREA